MNSSRPRARRKPDPIPGQLTFPFNIRMKILRKLKTGWTHAKHLLRVLDDHAGDGTDCWLKQETIAEEMETSVTTVKRAVKVAVNDELLIVSRKSRHGCNLYRLRRAEMRDKAGLSFEGDLPKDQPGLSEPDATGQPDRSEGSTCTLRGANLAPPLKPSLEAHIEAPMDGKHGADGDFDKCEEHARDQLHIEPAELLGPLEAIERIFERYLSSGASHLRDSDEDRRRFPALVHCLVREGRAQKITNPAGVLRWLLTRTEDPDAWRKRPLLEDEDHAKAQIAARDRKRERAPVVAGLAGGMSLAAPASRTIEDHQRALVDRFPESFPDERRQ
jgi:hypothetical protein